jgi:hypothetical protein
VWAGKRLREEQVTMFPSTARKFPALSLKDVLSLLILLAMLPFLRVSEDEG